MTNERENRKVPNLYFSKETISEPKDVYHVNPGPEKSRHIDN